MHSLTPLCAQRVLKYVREYFPKTWQTLENMRVVYLWYLIGNVMHDIGPKT